jgi:hypothetical protein
MSFVNPAQGVQRSEESPVSPELALVDPVLAAIERQRLPERIDTLSRLVSAGTPPPPLRLHTHLAPSRVDLVPVSTHVTASGMATFALDWVASLSELRLRRSTIAKFAAAAMVVTVTVAAVLEERTMEPEQGVPSATVDERMPMSSASESGLAESHTTAGAAPPSQPAQTSRQRAKKTAKQTSSPRRFAWAPVAGASGYRVEFYRGSELIFGAGTRQAQIAIPATWKSGGRVHRLEPGEYRWYVWPIVDKRRASSAIVQAKLAVP